MGEDKRNLLVKDFFNSFEKKKKRNSFEFEFETFDINVDYGVYGANLSQSIRVYRHCKYIDTPFSLSRK